ncbi:site-specific integrase [Candidatus Bathyarchaeota archaeon]|nr:MAG: site-specific integrase [Candidatus Bathyarchaeota archaeon]
MGSNPIPGVNLARDSVLVAGVRLPHPASISFLPRIVGLARELSLRFSEATVHRYCEVLGVLARFCCLDDGLAVVKCIDSLGWSDRTKRIAFQAYRKYAEKYGIKIPDVKFKKWVLDSDVPYVPDGELLNLLLSQMSPRYKVVFEVLRDTGLRVGELLQLKVEDLDTRKCVLNVSKRVSEKHGDTCEYRLNEKIVADILRFHGNRKGDWLFCGKDGRKLNYNILKHVIVAARKKVLAKYGIKEVKKIHIHTFRDYFATMLYAKTKDILLVKEKLRHKRLENTLKYIKVVQWNIKQYDVKIVEKPEEIKKLLEEGYTVELQKNGKVYMKKPII